jgi:hypothetical protein
LVNFSDRVLCFSQDWPQTEILWSRWDYRPELPLLACFWDRIWLTLLLPELSSNHGLPVSVFWGIVNLSHCAQSLMASCVSPYL